MKKFEHPSFILLAIALVICLSSSAFAVDGGLDGPTHKIVIQVSSDDPRTRTIALNNAVNLQKHYGMDQVAVEIVAYGPGLGMLTKNSEEVARVESLAMQNITFTACGNTMKKMEAKLGHAPALAEGVQVAPAGVVRILELQEQGYQYLRP